MNKKNKTKELKRNLVRITLILLLSLLVTFILCKSESNANNKILEETVRDAFTFQSILMAHDLEPNSPNDYTDISSLENTEDKESFVSDTAIKTGASQYYIRVNYGANCVTIFKKDDEGNYTKPYKAMICSTGKATPKSGTYKITYKYRWLSLYGGVYGQYSTRIVKSILFHSVPYFEQRADTLEYEEYDKLGTTASAGCIRLTVQDAKWIYDNITSGTYVEFYSDTSNPGPLGKPKAQKISSNKENRDWDPTDPDKNNPWNGGSGIPSVTYTTPNYNNKNNTKSNTTNKKSSTTVNNQPNYSTKEDSSHSQSNSKTETPSYTENKIQDNNELSQDTPTNNQNTEQTDSPSNNSSLDKGKNDQINNNEEQEKEPPEENSKTDSSNDNKNPGESTAKPNTSESEKGGNSNDNLGNTNSGSTSSGSTTTEPTPPPTTPAEPSAPSTPATSEAPTTPSTSSTSEVISETQLEKN